MNSDKNSAPVFKMRDIAKLYKTKLEQLGIAVDNRVHTTSLKKNYYFWNFCIWTHICDEEKPCWVFEMNIGSARMMDCQNDNDVTHLDRAAQVVHKDVFDLKF